MKHKTQILINQDSFPEIVRLNGKVYEKHG